VKGIDLTLEEGKQVLVNRIKKAAKVVVKRHQGLWLLADLVMGD
jgi:hypothetical protein|tara:strand:+ start:375 stop:506 length:132 start_codon:yes stop_codon:yes gene_type:complete